MIYEDAIKILEEHVARNFLHRWWIETFVKPKNLVEASMKIIEQEILLKQALGEEE